MKTYISPETELFDAQTAVMMATSTHPTKPELDDPDNEFVKKEELSPWEIDW